MFVYALLNMDDLTKHRKDRLRALIDGKPYAGNQAEFGRKTGLTKARITQLLSPDEPFGERAAESLCGKLELPPRWFEQGHSTGEGEMLPADGRVEANVEAGPSVKAAREIPVIGEVKGGDDGYLTKMDYPVGHGDGVVDYPTSDPNAYALRVRGDSMHPRYRAGEFVVVEPGVEPLPGDDVVVALHDGRKLLKELNWARDGEVQLLSINNHFGPLTIPLADVLHIQLVAGRVRRGAIRR